ncbi:MAG: hypothetical protein AAFQ54_10375 [Pseudomonadota bacterium]
MTKTLMGAALSALLLTSAATPARATDVATTILGVQLLVGLGVVLGTPQRLQGATSANTEYALTGQGTPVANDRYVARQPVKLVCHPYPGTCTTVPAH